MANPKAPMAETFSEKVSRTGREIVKKRWLFLLLVPGILFFVIFKYIPIFGLKIAFQITTNMTRQRVHGLDLNSSRSCFRKIHSCRYSEILL